MDVFQLQGLAARRPQSGIFYGPPGDTILENDLRTRRLGEPIVAPLLQRLAESWVGRVPRRDDLGCDFLGAGELIFQAVDRREIRDLGGRVYAERVQMYAF